MKTPQKTLQKILWAFLIVTTAVLWFHRPVRADPLQPFFTNDSTANTLTFNDSFGHDVLLGSYDSATGIWTSNNVSGGAGVFTTLSASGAVSGAGFTARFATPGPIGSTAASTGAFTDLSSSGVVSGAGFTARFATPGPIGSTVASTGAFSTLSASSTVSGAGFTARFSTPGPIGDTVASTGAFSTLSASGVVSGAGVTARFATPGPIGNTVASTGAFTTLGATNIIGTTDGVAGTAGNVGEIKSSSVAVGSAVAVVTGVPKDVTTLALTAGTWQCWGALATSPGAGTTTAGIYGSINAAANTQSTADSGDAIGGAGSAAANAVLNFGLSSTIIPTASTPTMHLVTQAFFGVSTMAVYGRITCVRLFR